jgi:hypothetical protein
LASHTSMALLMRVGSITQPSGWTGSRNCRIPVCEMKKFSGAVVARLLPNLKV